MSDPDLRRRAEAAGIIVDWTDAHGQPRQVSPDTQRALLVALGLDGATPAEIEAAAPARCFSLDRRAWGLAVQLYSLPRAGDGGIGDVTALGDCAEAAAKAGADALAVSPVHALFANDPTRFSPYAPSSRLAYNVLHADPGAAVDAADRPLIDWPEAAAARLAALRRLHAEQAGELGDDSAGYRAEGGRNLRDHAAFETLQPQLGPDWRRWPAAYRDPASPEVAAFLHEHAAEFEFHQFLQFMAGRGLDRAQARACAAGMSIGLIADLAVGTAPDGSEAWSRQGEMLTGVTIGAPPDIFNPLGQDWQITTYRPGSLDGFRALLRASLRFAGGLRIDHILGLARLWVLPEGASPAEGAYLRYPCDALLQVIAEESQRHRAIVIGEDLGTIPPGLRDKLDAAGVLGMRVLWFERERQRWRGPEAWDRPVAAMTTTHDLPTIAGWWTGRDIDWRGRLGLFAPGSSAEEEQRQREIDRHELAASLAAAGCGRPTDPEAAATAAIDFVGRTVAQLALIPIEDVLALPEQPNLPGTIDQHPNWRRRLPQPVAAAFADPRVSARLQALARERPKP